MANLIQLIGVLVWPTVVVIVVIVFRKPLADFLRGIAWRVTKFSITQIISVELSLPEASHPRLGEFLPELQAFASGLIGAEESSDARASLYVLWGEVGDKNIEYMIVDLGTGQQWLTEKDGYTVTLGPGTKDGEKISRPQNTLRVLARSCRYGRQRN